MSERKRRPFRNPILVPAEAVGIRQKKRLEFPRTEPEKIKKKAPSETLINALTCRGVLRVQNTYITRGE